ncbi:MAG: glucosamine-6-phosphate deaminase [Armatimonadota bacterium]|nr:MAG: glucosamine-6-phosphate deaminase [Armatimonadota bacterium]
MKVIVVPTKEEMGKRAAELIGEQMRVAPHFVMGLATGSTPLPLYAELIRLNKAGELDFSTTITFNLDEYVGLPGTHDQSYRRFMDEHLFDQININKAATHVPDGMVPDPEAFCEAYERMIDDVGGIDYQVLGIGSNGHIAFNEPGASLASRTRVVNLTKNTIKDNSRFFERIEDVPTRAISMGIGTILEAERIVLLAYGENKADAVAQALEGPVTVSCPASALQMHPEVTWVIVDDAASKLQLEWGR